MIASLRHLLGRMVSAFHSREVSFAKWLCPKLKGVLSVWRKLFGLGLQADSSNGAIRACSTTWGIASPIGAPLGRTSISISPSGKFAYLINQTSAVIHEFTITDNQSGCVSGATGGITLNGKVSVGPVQSLTQDPFAKFLYGAEGAFDDVLGDPTNGE
jgi:hypothetical protein